MTEFELWREKATDQTVISNLQQMTQDEERKSFAFCKQIEFGTAGLRGLMDAGTNCMNVYTVAQTTQALAIRLLSGLESEVVVSYDSRHNSLLFAQITATVLANNGLKVYLTEEIQPTPFLSFAVKHFSADAGVMITASHNSKEYNGYKVYGANGAQIGQQTADEIFEIIKTVDCFNVNTQGFLNHLNKGNIQYINKNVVGEYLNNVYSQSINTIDRLRVVYSPLNGCGHILVPKVLKNRGLTDLYLVSTQKYPSGDFTTCSTPNPEKKEALAYGIESLESNGYDILIATDPDCDRVGVAIAHKGSTVRLTGNEVGILLTDYLLSSKKANKTLSPNPIIIKTIVTTDLVEDIVKDYNGMCVDLLTGFKYIGEYVDGLTRQGQQSRFVLGFEESCGYLTGNYAGDKDAVLASMLIAEMASFHLKRGQTLVDRLEYIYSKYGYYSQTQFSLVYEGTKGIKLRQEAIDKLRATELTNLGGQTVLSITDLLNKNDTNLPKADVLIYKLSNDIKVIIRPSGTEPLVKFYLFAKCANNISQALFSKLEFCLKELLK
ncbi:MAG: phospho-sugar mutase [Clostridia bacterium]